MNIALCDDEPQITELLNNYLQIYFEKSCRIDIFNSGSELLHSSLNYQIIFLDISLGDTNGIDLAKKIRQKNKHVFIVFITNYEQYCHQAFSVHAFAYLIKPIKRQELFHALKEIELYQKQDIQEKSIRLKVTGGTIQLKLGQIYYFEYFNRKVHMVSESQKTYVNYTLSELFSLLQNMDFAMPHRAYIINLKKIKFINKYDIVLENGDSVPLAQKKAAAFKKQFEIYLYKQL